MEYLLYVRDESLMGKVFVYRDICVRASAGERKCLLYLLLVELRFSGGRSTSQFKLMAP